MVNFVTSGVGVDVAVTVGGTGVCVAVGGMAVVVAVSGTGVCVAVGGIAAAVDVGGIGVCVTVGGIGVAVGPGRPVSHPANSNMISVKPNACCSGLLMFTVLPPFFARRDRG
jgi:hypothetical protein